MKKNNEDLLELKKLSKDEYFKEKFRKLCLNEELNDTEKEFILTCSLMFFKYYNLDKRLKGYFKIGYFIILKYTLNFNNYKPLYEICLQIGFYPIIDFITKLEKKIYKVDSKNLILDAIAFISYKRDFESPEKYIESLEQNISRNSIIKSQFNKVAYIAPTSYGKSSLIKEFIKIKDFLRIAVIVPSKSLLVQTYKDIKALNLDYKLILHDEMYNNEEKFIGILTQERATRLLNKNLLINYEVMFIDEAHKLFDRDSRSYILTRLIQLNHKRNYSQKIVYLSPLIDNVDNLKVKSTNNGEIFTKKIQHDFKSFELYLYKSKKSYFYDRFTDSYFDLINKTNYFEYIIENSGYKNFVFHSRPKIVERLAKKISKKTNNDLSNNKEIKKIIDTLNKEVHKSFYVVNYIRKGVIYIHAKIPNIIKEYLEEKFKNINDIKYIVANSVILEGINLPIDTIFITTNGTGNKNERLKVKDLINLIGRANRLNEVFSKDKPTLKGLLTKIHFLDNKKYQGKNSIETALKSLREHTFKDVIKNPLIENYDINNLEFSGTKEKVKERKEKQMIEDDKLIKYSEFILEEPINFNFEIKKYLIENSINVFYKDLDYAIDKIIGQILKFNFNDDLKIVDIVKDIFVLENEDNIKDYELERLKNIKARNYYNHFLEVTQKLHLNERINETLKYFIGKSKTEDPLLYIGSSYGETSRTSKIYDNDHYNRNVYINLNKPENILVNIAIVKLKLEEDFVSFKLNSLIVFLYEFNLITEEYYFKYVYGTTDLKVIKFVRFGLSVNTINKLKKDKQLDNLKLDINGNLFVEDKDRVNFEFYLKKQPELFQFEIKKYLQY
ncbi:DEAD/DEAH box helicase [Flavobacterium sp. TP390]|uniref:DEAD/DEAH box helicase n=1 Tax=Flavobacterium profundi TaxID=1774945 RepID=A0A6I4IGH1_9FLAO|nr:DEAD/DEAH box helicase [Flavobacterium profundi]MVO08785.1 DEAD/DEAH box helicase [Flavobacterium profundi]